MHEVTVPPTHSGRSLPLGAREASLTLADGWRIRTIDCPPAADAPPRGSILMLPGRGDAYEKWVETLSDWCREGWHCLSADWRGQALSGRLGQGQRTGHIDDFAIWIDDLAQLWTHFVETTPAPHMLFGHSMGGHLALRGVAEGRVHPDALVLTAPMLGLLPGWMPSAALHALARLLTGLGNPGRPAWKGAEKPELIEHARKLLLTHDARRYDDEEWWRERRPGIQMGAASWRWVERALASIRLLERPGVLEAATVPVLILGTRQDRLVSWPAIKQAAARLPHCTLVAYGD